MGFADIIDAALSTQPGYRQAALWPQEQERGRLANEHMGLVNQALSSNVDTLQRQEDINTRAPGELARWYQQAAAQPGTINRPGAMDLNENPEAAGTPAQVSPGQPPIRTMQDLMARMPPTEASAPYLPQAAKDLGLITPEAQQQKGSEEEIRQATLEGQQAKNVAAQRGVGLTDEIEQALQSGDVGKARVLGAVLSASRGDTRDLDLILRTQGQNGAGGPTPRAIEIPGLGRMIEKPNAQGINVWTPDRDPIQDWIARNPNKVAGLDPASARDVASEALDIRKKTDAANIRVTIGQPAGSQAAIDRDAEYFNKTGKITGGVRNLVHVMAVKNRAAELALATPGAAGLAQVEANYKSDVAELSKLKTQRGPLVTFMNTASAHLDRADQLSQAVDRTQIPVVNAWLLSGQTKWTGDPGASTFAAVTRLAVDEVAKVISSATGGGGVVSDAARREVEAVLTPAMATGQFSAVSQALRKLMQDKAREYEATITATNDRIDRLGRAGSIVPAAAAPAATSGVPSFAEWKARQGR